jgi:hypothetical protein
MAISKIPSAGISNTVNFRNIIINGDMSIAQRGTSHTTANAYTLDRWHLNDSTSGAFTITQSTTVPSGQGFAKSYKLDCTTADASPDANEYLIFNQRIEGQNLQYLKKGTSSAESLTLSFWVRSNKTGTYIAELFDHDNSRQISKSYTISAADTWEKKTITFDGDTSGTLDNDNARSFDLSLWLMAGSNFSSGTLNTSWNSVTSANRVVGQVNIADSTSNEWYVTGVQLEAGTSASDFEFLPVDVNLQRCQRYYLPLFDGSPGRYIANAFYYATTHIKIHVEAPVDMRVTPSIEQTVASNCWIMYSNADGQTFSNSIVMDGDLKTRFFSLYANAGDVSGTSGHAGGFYGVSGGGGTLALSAEL